MDDAQKIVKCGALSLYSSNSFFRKWTCKYLVLYSGSKSGIKRLEMFDSEMKFKKQSAAKIISLVNCVRVVTCQRQKSTYTFEVRTNESFFLLAANSYQDMSDWVTCLRLVAFGELKTSFIPFACSPNNNKVISRQARNCQPQIHDVLLSQTQPPLNASSQVLDQKDLDNEKLKSRQRQPSFMTNIGTKLQPPSNSPFVPQQTIHESKLQTKTTTTNCVDTSNSKVFRERQKFGDKIGASDEEEENLLYCSIEDNPSEHSYRVKIIETELASRCELKCYQLTEPATVCEQYEQLGAGNLHQNLLMTQNQPVWFNITFYQLIVGPQALTLLNDYAALLRPSTLSLSSSPFDIDSQQTKAKQSQQQVGLWSWPYQCIRRYGFDKDNCFMFEAGRKCSSGPGQFIVQTPKAYSIYKDVVKFVNQLRAVTDKEAAQQQSPTANEQPKASTSTTSVISTKPVTQIPVSWSPPKILPACQQQTTQPSQNIDEPISSNQGPINTNQKNIQPAPGRQQTSIVPKSSSNSQENAQPRNSQASSDLSSSSSSPSSSKHSSIVSTAEETDESGYGQCFNEDSENSSDTLDSNSINNQQNISLNKLVEPTTQSQVIKTHQHQTQQNHTIVGKPLNKLSPQVPQKPQMTKRIFSSKDVNTVNDSKLHQDAAFRVNLIRDVYHEISQLQQARFAMTSDTASDASNATVDDSISCVSSSSSTSSSNSLSISKNNAQTNQQQQQTHVNRGQLINQQNLTTAPMLPPRPLFLQQNHSNLKPILECNETIATTVSDSNNLMSNAHRKQTNNSITNNSNISNSARIVSRRDVLSNLNIPTSNNNNNINNNNNNSPETLIKNHTTTLNSRHYFINNVQYTKVNK